MTSAWIDEFDQILWGKVDSDQAMRDSVAAFCVSVLNHRGFDGMLRLKEHVKERKRFLECMVSRCSSIERRARDPTALEVIRQFRLHYQTMADRYIHIDPTLQGWYQVADRALAARYQTGESLALFLFDMA